METIKLDLIPGKKMPSLHASQYDDGREHGIDLFENGVVYKLDGTETLTINERKGDDCICSLDIENTFTGSNHIVFASTEQMCAVWGNNICELVIAKGEKTIGTLNFILEIEPSPTENGIESESEIKNLKRQVEAITEEVIGDDYYTKTQTDNAIATAVEGKADKTDTYTKTQTDNLLNAKANTGDVYTKSQTDNLLNDKANVTDLPDMTQYYDKSEVDDLLDDKANSDDVYGKAYIDTALSGKANVGTSYTKSEEDALLANKADKSDTYTKEQVDDIVYDILPDDTASGSVANFETDLALPIKSLYVDVNASGGGGTPTTPIPISGVSEVDLFRRRKNLLDKSSYSFVNAANIVWGATLQGYADGTLILPAGTYTFSVSVACSGLYISDDKSSIRTVYNNTSITFTVDKTKPIKVMIYKSGVTKEDFLGYDYQLELGSTVTDYEPYVGNEYIINLGGTYYGGHFTQDKDGHRQFEVTHSELFDMGNLEWRDFNISNNVFRCIVPNCKEPIDTSDRKNGFLCSIYPPSTNGSINANMTDKSMLRFGGYLVLRDTSFSDYTEIASAVGGQKLFYELATPIIIDLPDGEPIITLNGTNNIYADTGDCAVEYKCSVAEYVANHSGGGGAKSLGGVFLGGSNSGSEEEQKEEPTEEPKEVTKTLGDEPISKK